MTVPGSSAGVSSSRPGLTRRRRLREMPKVSATLSRPHPTGSRTGSRCRLSASAGHRLGVASASGSGVGGTRRQGWASGWASAWQPARSVACGVGRGLSRRSPAPPPPEQLPMTRTSSTRSTMTPADAGRGQRAPGGWAAPAGAARILDVWRLGRRNLRDRDGTGRIGLLRELVHLAARMAIGQTEPLLERQRQGGRGVLRRAPVALVWCRRTVGAVLGREVGAHAREPVALDDRSRASAPPAERSCDGADPPRVRAPRPLRPARWIGRSHRCIGPSPPSHVPAACRRRRPTGAAPPARSALAVSRRRGPERRRSADCPRPMAAGRQRASAAAPACAAAWPRTGAPRRRSAPGYRPVGEGAARQQDRSAARPAPPLRAHGAPHHGDLAASAARPEALTARPDDTASLGHVSPGHDERPPAGGAARGAAYNAKDPGDDLFSRGAAP